MDNNIEYQENEKENKECVYDTIEHENEDPVVVKIEKKSESLKHRIKISNTLREFFRKENKYEPYFLYMLEDPTTNTRNQITLSEIRENQSLEKCQGLYQGLDQKQGLNKEQGEEQPEYYLCKYKKADSQSIQSYIRENPELLTLTDIHNVLLETITELYKNTQITNLTITPETIRVTKVGTPLITEYSHAFDALNERKTQESEPDETKCLELHMLYFLEKQKKTESPNTKIFTESNLDEIYEKLNPEHHPPKEQIKDDYINKTYEEVYERATQTMESWDTYSVTYMFWKMDTSEIDNALIQKYKDVLKEILTEIPEKRLTKNIFERMMENMNQSESNQPLTSF
jgi:hypothetical protein